MIDLERFDRAADVLLKARETGGIDRLDDELAPSTIAEAYAVQDATLRRLGQAGGWKIAARPDCEPRCAVLPAISIHRSGATLHVPASGFELEVETAFVVDKLPRPGIDPVDWIGSVHLAIEVLGSRFVDRRSLPPLQPIADLQSNAAVVLGPTVTDWHDRDLSTLDMKLKVDGKQVESGQRHHSRQDVASMLTWLAAHAAERGIPLEAGTVVITGARVGPLPLDGGQEVIASCAGWGDVAIKFSY